MQPAAFHALGLRAREKFIGDHGGAHAGVLAQRRLHFGEFDPETADADAPVDPADPLDVPSGRIPTKIAGTKQPVGFLARERVDGKIRRRERSSST